MIAFLRNERGANLVEERLAEPSNQCFAHSVNLCEVFYDFYRSGGQEIAGQALEDLARAGIVEVAKLDREFWQSAGKLKAVHRRVSLADCFLIALAQQLQAKVLTADHHEFDALLDQAVCTVEFIR